MLFFRTLTSPAAVALALLLIAAPAAPAAGQSDRLTVEDIFNIEHVADPQISPDGEWVVYVRHFADIMTDSRYSNLWIIRFDGSEHRPLTTGNYNDNTPRWSPDGRRLAYVSDRDDISQIYVRWMDAGETAAITNLSEPPSAIAWSPDGSQLAFMKRVPAPRLEIGQMPEPPEGAEWAEPAWYIDKLVYRFDGVGDLKPGYVHLFVVPAEGGTARQISSGDFHHGGAGFARAVAPPVWTPDGEYLLIPANRRPDYELEPRDTDIYEFSVRDGSMRKLTDRHGPDNAPVVAPDGRRIAYVGFDERYQGYQLTQLYVMNRDGSGARVLSTGLDRSISSPTWAPDNSGVYALYDDHGNTKLALFSLDASHRVLTGDIGTLGSAYGVGDAYTVARNGRIAMTHTTPRVLGDLAVSDRRGRELRQITAVNADVFIGKKLGDVEEIWYESSLDGRRIQGWVIKPPDFDPALKYPLILEIHGGPFANYGDRFDLEKQIMAAQGYAVLYVNPRGSTSYGEEFGNLIHHAYPGDDFYDLNSGIDAMIEKGYVDDQSLYVAGGSGGGVLTAWMVGNTERFRAAVSWYPVINWYSFNLTADIAPFTAKNWFPGLPWDQVEHYESRSLLSVVNNVTTPTMIMTGEEDYRTPMSESEQYYKALKLLGVETVLVRVPGEPHGIRRRPSHHMAKLAGSLGWFARHRSTTF